MLDGSPAAFEDREAIFDYIAAESPKAAAIMDAAISRQVERLLAHPQSGRMGLVPGTRELPIPRSPYLVAYRILEDRIRLLRILHGAQSWPGQMED